MKKIHLYIVLASLFCACQSPTENQEQKTSDTIQELEQDPESLIVPVIPEGQLPLVLFGAYATSSATGSDLSEAFDGNSNTFWRTMEGAGPDEGIMLYFQKPVFIQSVAIEPMTGRNFADLEEITVYGNGSPINRGNAVIGVDIDSLVSNIFIRFSRVGQMAKMSSNLNGFYNTLHRDSFSIRHSVGIREIQIKGEAGKNYKVIPPQKVKGRLEASSTLNPETFAYHVNNLFDARKEFAWVEGAQGNGEGERLTFDFETEQSIKGIWLWNGYQRSQSHFDSNARLKKIQFGLKEGTATAFSIEDTIEPQYLELDTPVKGKTFELVVSEVFKGWSYKDLAISEMLFVNEDDVTFKMVNNNLTDIQKAYQAKAKGNILENLLDRRIYNFYEMEDGPAYMERSVILRSDGTFVLYSKEEDEFEAFELIADGNWEIESTNADEARLKVFGRLMDFSNLEQYYAGDTEADLSRIFRDVLMVRAGYIRGEKFLVGEIVF